MRERDTSSSGSSASVSSAGASNDPNPQPGASTVGGPGSRVGAGVALGVLVLLVGWMFIGAWIALSWMLW